MSNYAAFLRKDEEDRAKFDQFVAKGKRRVTEQMLLIEQLRADGHDTTRAEKFLEELRSNLAEWHQTRTDVTQVMQTYELLERTDLAPRRFGVSSSARPEA
ncbi:hypothetical protein [Microvirga yunnanensis]|uniref:hypothetical protein n=1 Tax=Microvirga yunnanensis TaxID=2953740 RepID=UPI0021CA0E5E|nr:hypothetical protein [Microvirga sp. HBU65207]